ncbi:hypothetical protein [Streptomyces sp. AFD10]|uniref:hypothetical protein n=1 Tax=Streptomyces sp. AFD10 TaxID=3050948 RepID=UPI0034DFC351
MLREPAELRVDDQGRVELPLGILAEAGIAPGIDVMAFSEGVTRRSDAVTDLIERGTL